HPDATDASHAVAILEDHGLMERVPASVARHLRAASSPRTPLTPVPHIILGDNQTMVNAACEHARLLGFEPRLLDIHLKGNTHDCARRFCAALKDVSAGLKPDSAPLLLVAAGETTLKVRGNGKGGRNQEFAAVAAQELSDVNNCALLAAGSDGTDGPTDA